MADFVKKKIVEKLARFTKHLKPSDISLSFLSGKGHLSNLELNGEFISAALQLPPWVVVSRVVCDTIKARVPFTNITTDPVNFYIGQVLIDISTSTETTATTAAVDPKSMKIIDQLSGNNPSKYGLIDKIVDGMRVEIRSVLVFLKDPMFHAQLEIMDILIESTSWQWKVVPLSKARVRNEEEDSVINYKVCSWSSLKIEGWSTADTASSSQKQLRLIAGPSRIYITFKRSVSDSSILCSRIVVSLGDIIWVLTQSQLRAVSRLVQSLMDAAVRTQQQQRQDGDDSSLGSLESLSSEKGSQKTDKSGKETKRKKPKSSSQREQAVQERISQYREGKLNLPAHDVVQNSFHFKTAKVDLQLCDDTSGSELTDTVQGSMLIQVFKPVVDIYLDQPAGAGRSHWNKSNDVIDWNTKWSKKLITKASKTQFMDLPSVNTQFLRERGVVIRCSDFSVGALKSGEKKQKQHTLPILTSDKSTFNIPDDVHNPALQVGISLYFYPEKYGSKFLVPRPNMLVYMSPVHLSFHQESCLWLIEFIHGVVRTVNIELALSVKDEGKSFLEERKAQSVQVEQLPGMDFKFKILFTKVTLPLPDAVDDGRPKALQIETAAIEAKNSPLNELMNRRHFSAALQALKEGWAFTSQDNPQFPHYQEDLRALPVRLQELLQQRIRTGRMRGESSSEEFSGSAGLAPEANHSELVAIEGWHVSTACVHVAFVDSYATLHTRTFVDDFPLHLWLFLPPSSLDSSLPPSPSISSNSDELKDPKFSLIIHVPSDIRVELERLQLLFLMRLKDSFTDFKSSLMKFLDPDTFAPHLKETLEAHRLATNDMEEDTPPVTISGCIVLSRVEASILLPTMCSTNPSSNSNPSSSLPTDPSSSLPTDLRTMPTDLCTTTEVGGMTKDGVTHTTDPVMVTPDYFRASQDTMSLKRGVITPPPKASPTPSRTSLSEANMVSVAEPPDPLLLREAGTIISPSPSGSQSSLPNILESEGESAKINRSIAPYASTSQLSTDLGSNQLLPARSLSAVELLPLQRRQEFKRHSAATLDDAQMDHLSEEEFVLVKHPTASPFRQNTTAELPWKPVSAASPCQPTGLVMDTSSAGVNQSSENSSQCASPLLLPPPSTLSPSYSVSSMTLSNKSTSSRRLKSPAPLRTLPQFVLHAQVQHIFLLPNIKAGEISVRVSADTVGLRELGTKEYQGMKEMMNKRSAHVPPPPANTVPSIRARLEVGEQVRRLYPSDCEPQDIILIAKVEGLDLSLLLPNITIMKDFFDDEFEVLPVPLHLKVATTRAVLVEDLSHGADHVQSMAVGVEQLEVHRGRELKQGVDIFLEESVSEISRYEADDSAVPTQHGLEGSDDQLLHSFSDFISVFEAHVQHYGRVHLPKPQRIAELLQELQTALVPPPRSNVSPPPTYAEVVPYSYLQSSARRSTSELLHLRRENEQLRQVQRQCERMSAQLQESQVEINRRENDLMMVTDECKHTKEQLVSYKQVMEKQQEHIEKLLTENFDLQRQLLAPS